MAINGGIDFIVLLGDLLDFYDISWFCKDPRRRRVDEEIETAVEVLTIIRREFPDNDLIYKTGNHEERLDMYLMRNAPKLYKMKYTDLGTQLEQKSIGFKIVEDRRLIKFGKLNLIHSHELGRMLATPVNPARTLFLRAKVNCLGGHFHRPSHNSVKTMNDEHVGTWSIGSLCDLKPEWQPVNEWSHGFAIIEMLEEDGNFSVDNKKIIDNHIFNA